ncbi:putative CCR4-associated factor 1-like protein 11-like [Hibiscus syriacus]|uniref:CCR4-associated factor 1-like protein 11-like n=1 Tax=Hibiscus syriacus TaxID=106335 RepID=A0A6A3BVE5_HIBSY|nr:putative CCR4-associated factor 1-like protein 11-like [Hibiscus syriacus]
MSRRNGPKLDLKLNLSPPSRNPRVGSPSRSATASPTSPPSSCVSSEMDIDTNSGDTSTSMVLVGCPRCLMYVMLSEDDPKCPKCKSTVLLDFLRDTANTASTNTRKSS